MHFTEEQIDVEEIIAEAGAKTATESDYHGEIIAEAGAKTAPESDYHFTETKDVAKEERFDAVPLAFPGARKGTSSSIYFGCKIEISQRRLKGD